MRKHPIVKFAEARGLEEGKAAKLLGVSHQMWCDMKAGRRWPSPKRARLIVRRSGGALTLEQLLFWKPAA